MTSSKWFRAPLLHPIALVLIATSLMLGCVHPPPGGEVRSESTITEDEIDATHSFNAYEVVFKLRREFLVSRGKVSLDPSVAPALPNVYVDRQFYGDVEALKAIPAGTVESITFVSASESQYRYGRGNMAGVIEVVTRH